MDGLIEKSYPADTEALSIVRSTVRDACRQAGCSDECLELVVLAVNEACMNIIQHGYRFATGNDFLLRLAVDDAVLVVQLLDNGRSVSDGDLRPRELEELRPGGLGVRFMREVMDEVAYIAAPRGYVNCLQLRKHIR